MLRVVFLRHGQTDWNAARKTMGQVDIPLNRTGIKEALSARAYLSALRITSVWQSPLLRCRQTARLGFGCPACIPIRTIPDLAERFWGPWQGQCAVGRPDFFGCPSGAEPYSAFEMRVAAALAHVVASPEVGALPAVVAHSGVYRALVRKAGGATDGVEVPHARPMVLHLSRDRFGPAFTFEA